MNAKGTDAAANGQNKPHEKCPARQNCTDAIDATNKFSTNAVGRVTPGATAKNAITAKYPDAPPWPTEEYSTATTNIAATIANWIGSIRMSDGLKPELDGQQR